MFLHRLVRNKIRLLMKNANAAHMNMPLHEYFSAFYSTTVILLVLVCDIYHLNIVYIMSYISMDVLMPK